MNDDFLSLSDDSEEESDLAILEANRKRAEEAEQRIRQREEDRRLRRESRSRRSGGTISELVEAPLPGVSGLQNGRLSLSPSSLKRPADQMSTLSAVEAMGLTMARSLESGLKVLVDPLKASLAKRSKAEGDLSEPEEDTVLNVESVELSDNNVDVVNMDLRAKLRIPNGPCSEWWSKAWAGQRTTRPVLGASLYLDNFQGSTRPSDSTIKRFHDRYRADAKLYVSEMTNKCFHWQDE